MNLEKMKEKFESGDYVALVKRDGVTWDKLDNVFWQNVFWQFVGDNNFRLINKKHQGILDAYLADNNIQIEYKYNPDTWLICNDKFIEEYDENIEFRILEPQLNIVTDFSNTYCVCNEENYRKLLTKVKNYPRWDVEKIKRNSFVFIGDDTLSTLNCRIGLKQIEYNKSINQWVYVTDKDVGKSDKKLQKQLLNSGCYGFPKEDPTQKYLEIDGLKFEYMKDCKLFEVYKNRIHGRVGEIQCKWDLNGKDLTCESLKYNLTPIKKPWYKQEEKFNDYKGKLIISKLTGAVRRIQDINSNRISTHEQNMYHDALNVGKWELLTKEEILSLMVHH